MAPGPSTSTSSTSPEETRSGSAPPKASQVKIKRPQPTNPNPVASTSQVHTPHQETGLTETTPGKKKSTAPKKGRGKQLAKPKNLVFEPGTPLTKEQVKCSICQYIFLDPVTFPCNHTVCLKCYEEHKEKGSLSCPLCRSRLSNFSRTTKENDLVNEPFWNEIKSQFPEAVEARQNGDESYVFFDEDKGGALDGTLVDDVAGQILMDYETIQACHAADIEKRRQEEEAASVKLIEELISQEGSIGQQSAEHLQADFEFALTLQNQTPLELEPGGSGSQLPSNAVSSTFVTHSEIEEIPGQDEQIRAALDEEDESSTNASLVSDYAQYQQWMLNRLKQEEEDMKFAKKLQRKLNAAERQKLQNHRPETRNLTKTSAPQQDENDGDSATSSLISTNSGRLLNCATKRPDLVKGRKRKLKHSPLKELDTNSAKSSKTSRNQKSGKTTKSSRTPKTTSELAEPQPSTSTSIRNYFKPLLAIPTSSPDDDKKEPVESSRTSETEFVVDPPETAPERRIPDAESDAGNVSMEEILADIDNDILEMDDDEWEHAQEYSIPPRSPSP